MPGAYTIGGGCLAHVAPLDALFFGGTDRLLDMFIFFCVRMLGVHAFELNKKDAPASDWL